MKKIRLRIEHLFMLIFAFFAALGHPLGREIQLVPRCRFGTYIYLWLSHSICEKGLN